MKNYFFLIAIALALNLQPAFSKPPEVQKPGDSQEVKNRRSKCYMRINDDFSSIDANIKFCDGWAGRIEIVNNKNDVIQNVAGGCKFYDQTMFRKDKSVPTGWPDIIDNKIKNSGGFLTGSLWLCSPVAHLKFSTSSDFDSWKSPNSRLKIDGLGEYDEIPPMHYSTAIVKIEGAELVFILWGKNI